MLTERPVPKTQTGVLFQGSGQTPRMMAQLVDLWKSAWPQHSRHRRRRCVSRGRSPGRDAGDSEATRYCPSLLHLPPRPNDALFGRRGIASIKMIDLILPHVQEDTGRYIIDGLPNALDSRKCIFPDRTLAPLLTLLFALVRGAH
jgi:hypothetical protein